MATRNRSFASSLIVALFLVSAAVSGETARGPVIQDQQLAQPSPQDYRIGIGDVLQISVWREPEASIPSVVVRSDGKISAPLLKELHVEGMTPSEVEKLLTEKMRHIINEADVTVVVLQINSKKIYLLGAVKKEGAVALPRPMTVLQAVSEGGGFTEFARIKKIYILRRENGKQVRLPYDYQAVVRGGNLQQDILLQADDTIVVPK